MIRSANWLGDAVMTVPALMAVRETYPDAHIAVVANPLVAQLLENHPGCDEIIVYNKRAEHAGVLGMLRFAADLRRRKFDCAILFQYAIEAGIMAFLAGIPRRLGFTTDGRRIFLKLLQRVTRAAKPSTLCCSVEKAAKISLDSQNRALSNGCSLLFEWPFYVHLVDDILTWSCSLINR